jgi:hypothetical protein
MLVVVDTGSIGSYKSNYRTITTTIALVRLWSSWTSFHVLCTVSVRLFCYVFCYMESSNLAQTRCTRYNIMWYRLSVTCDRSVIFSGTPVSSTNKTDCHDITEILLKVALNIINPKSNLNIMLYPVHLTMSGVWTHNFSGIGTDCTGSCKSKYHVITAMTAPDLHSGYIAMAFEISDIQFQCSY